MVIYIHIHTPLNYFAVHLKLILHCKSTILQGKKRGWIRNIHNPQKRMDPILPETFITSPLFCGLDSSSSCLYRIKPQIWQNNVLAMCSVCYHLPPLASFGSMPSPFAMHPFACASSMPHQHHSHVWEFVLSRQCCRLSLANGSSFDWGHRWLWE